MFRELTVEQLVGDAPWCEGPAFDEQGRLHFVNWEKGAILRLNADGSVTEVANTGGIPAGLAFDRAGVLHVADEGADNHGVLKVMPDGTLTPFVQTYDGRPLNGANDLVFDRNGILYFSDPWGSSLEKPIGGFYRAFPDGRLEQIDAGLAFPNGVAVSADGEAVFLAETWTNRIHRYELRPDGTVGPRVLFATLPDEPGPDGMAFDAEGRLFVAHHGAGRVDVLSPDGQVIDAIGVPGKGVTNVAFGGDDLRCLVITEVETAAIYQVRLPVAGQRLYGGPRHG